MGLVRNLKKILSNMVDKVLAELCYLYILQKAEQTTKRQGNYLITKSLQNPLTTGPRSTIIATSSQGTSEKIIMDLTTEEIVVGIREWTLDRMDNTNHENAQAIYEEFAEWIDLDNVDSVDIMSIENE
mgnify:CR=1 FL=1